jgi:lipopolysaccharide/colanic/teichoic acid biosynthesis glycosyltransferase
MAIENTSAPQTRIHPCVVSTVSGVPAPRRRSPAGQRRRSPMPARACQQRGDSHVVREDLFKGALIRERKRSDRSNQPFVLLLVTADDSDRSSLPWSAAVAAVMAAKRDTDIVGWFKHRSVLGVILSEIGVSPVVLPQLEARVRQGLSDRLDQATAARFSIGLFAHMPIRSGGGPDFQPIDPLLGEIGPRKGRADYDAFKRALDVAGSLALLTVLSPLLLLAALLVKFRSPGPVFFRQTRIGLNARPFTMLKFRTMHVNADHGVHQKYVSWFIKSSGQTSEPGKDPLFKIANDPRVTAVGRLLRKTSMDELPQLLNVLRGDMSLVGPRPPLDYEVDQYEPWHCRRVLEAKPGITGLWQVSGRSRTTFDEMVRLDLRYARKRSLWNDIKILLATPTAVFSGKGAC